MKKQKTTTINISEISSSDDESQAKPHKEDFSKYIKNSNDESSTKIFSSKTNESQKIENYSSKIAYKPTKEINL